MCSILLLIMLLLLAFSNIENVLGRENNLSKASKVSAAVVERGNEEVSHILEFSFCSS